MIKVVIADDHILIRGGFKKLIESESDLDLSGEAEDARQLLSCLNENPCDVLVLDISLPDKSGLDILKDIAYQYPAIKILILSMHPEERYAKRALHSGASGYITKASAPDELVKAIRKVNSGGKYISESLAEELAGDLSGGASIEPHKSISNREFQILLLIGMGKSVKEISYELSLSINTVNTYRRRILDKMNMKTNAELIQYVIQHNLLE